jgi:acyl-coenzyme A thioesterase PaaI-like protein
MAGSAGLAVQRVFWDEEKQCATTVVWFGSGMAGWPGVVHGGALATVMDESLGRVAVRLLPERTGESSIKEWSRG